MAAGGVGAGEETHTVGYVHFADEEEGRVNRYKGLQMELDKKLPVPPKRKSKPVLPVEPKPGDPIDADRNRYVSSLLHEWHAMNPR